MKTEDVNAMATAAVMDAPGFLATLLSMLLDEHEVEVGIPQPSTEFSAGGMDWTTLDFKTQLKAFVLFDMVLGRLKGLIDTVTEQYDHLEPVLREGFAENGMKSTNAYGRCIYTYSQVIAVRPDTMDQREYIAGIKGLEVTVVDPESIRMVSESNGVMQTVWSPLQREVTEQVKAERCEELQGEILELEQQASDLKMKLARLAETPAGTVETVKQPLKFLVTETVNYQTAGAWARELPQTPMGDPVIVPELQGKVNILRKVSLRTRKG